MPAGDLGWAEGSWDADDEAWLWTQIKAEARRDVELEPALASYPYSTILSHSSLERSPSFYLGNKLCSSTLPSTLLYNLFLTICSSDPSLLADSVADLCAAHERDPACVSFAHCLLNYKGFLACQWDPKTRRPARRELSLGKQRAVPRTPRESFLEASMQTKASKAGKSWSSKGAPRESFPESSMQTNASKAGKSWSSKGAVPRAPSESSPDTNMQIDISSDSNGTTCAVVRYKKGFLFVTDGRRTKSLKKDERKIICDDVIKFRYVCKDQFGHDICSVSAGSVKTIGRLWKRVLECELSPHTVSEVVDLVQKTLMAVYNLKDFKSGETCSIIIAGGLGQEIFHVGGRLADMPHYISCDYHVIGSGSRFVNAALEVLYSDQHDEETLVRTVEKSYLFASLHDQSTGGFIKFYNVHGEIHQHLFTKHTLELYRDIYANHIKPDEVAVLIFSKDFDKKRIHKCFHKETVLRHAHVLGYVRGYQVNRVVLKRTDYENHLCTVRFVEEKLLSSGYVPECRDPVIKDFNLSFYKLSQKHRKGPYYFTEVSRDILKDLVPQGMVEGLIGRNANHPGREQSLENVERRLVVKTGPKESPGLEDVLNEFLGEEPMPEEVPGDVYDELEINQLEVPARAGKEQPEDSMNPECDDDITGDSNDNLEICVFGDSGDQVSSICPGYQKSKESWGPHLKENGHKIFFSDICGY